MHQASLGKVLGPRGSAASRHERAVQNHRDMAERLGLPWPEKGREVGAPSMQELYDSALYRAIRGGEWDKPNKINLSHGSRLVEAWNGHS
eukprot:5356318-Amphidinium_carterae.1